KVAAMTLSPVFSGPAVFGSVQPQTEPSPLAPAIFPRRAGDVVPGDVLSVNPPRLFQRRNPILGCAVTKVKLPSCQVSRRRALTDGLLRCPPALLIGVRSRRYRPGPRAQAPRPSFEPPGRLPRRSRTRRTCIGNHWPPFGAAMPRALRSVAM